MREKSSASEKNKIYISIALLAIVVLFIIYIIFKISNPEIFYSPDNIPTINSVEIFSISNMVSSDLVGLCNPSDLDSDDENLSCSYAWYKNNIKISEGVSNCTRDVNNNINNISSRELSAGNWTFSCMAFDSFNYSEWKNVSSFIDMIPIVNFGSTTNSGIVKQRSILINISAEDVNLDSIKVELYNSTNLIYNSTTNTSVFYLATDLSDGLYTLNASANDSNANVNLTSRTIILDNQAPNFTNLEYKILPYNVPTYYQISATDNNELGCISFADNKSTPYFNLTCSGLLTNISLLAKGEYWLNLSVNDSVGNVFHTTSVIVVTSDKDILAPLISNVAVSANLTFATVSWQTDELSNSLIKYGKNASDMSGSASSNSLVNNHLFTLNDLTNSSLYYYNVTSCDSSGNCKVYSSNFTTSTGQIIIVPDNSTDYATYSLSYSSLVSGYTKSNLEVNDVIKVEFAYGIRKNVSVSSISTSRASLLVDGTTTSFLVGDSKEFDLNNDNIKEIIISLISINDSKISIKIEKSLVVDPRISDPLAGNPIVEGNETPLAGEEEDSDYSAYIIWGMIILIVLILIILAVLKKKELVEWIQRFNVNKKPSDSYIRMIDLIKRAEFFIQQHQRDKVSALYNLIRSVYPSLSSKEKENLKPRILRIFNMLKGNN